MMSSPFCTAHAAAEMGTPLTARSSLGLYTCHSRYPPAKGRERPASLAGGSIDWTQRAERRSHTRIDPPTSIETAEGPVSEANTSATALSWPAKRVGSSQIGSFKSQVNKSCSEPAETSCDSGRQKASAWHALVWWPNSRRSSSVRPARSVCIAHKITCKGATHRAAERGPYEA
eukprot:6174334-Pleurochrysis_carterae.AAC.5